MVDNIEIPFQKQTIVTTGFFDGVHLGHLKIIHELLEMAREKQLVPVLVTLWPHPRYVLGKGGGTLKLINSLEEKTALLKKNGLDTIYTIPFTRAFSRWTAREFITNELIKKLNMKCLLVGFNHRFGNDGVDDLEVLRAMGSELDFEVLKTKAAKDGDITISSSLIRRELHDGKIERANQHLGYPYFVTGTVTEGNKIGRTIGFPTANIQLVNNEKLIPKDGVYVVQVKHGNTIYNGMLNIGKRPTIKLEVQEKSIEVHLFDFKGNLYNQKVELQFLKRLRDEVAFNSLDDLKKQLGKDKKFSLGYFKKLQK